MFQSAALYVGTEPNSATEEPVGHHRQPVEEPDLRNVADMLIKAQQWRITEKFGLKLICLISLIYSVANAVGQDDDSGSSPVATGSVCLAVLPEPTVPPKTLSNPAGGDLRINATVRIDDRELIPLSYESSTIVEGLELLTDHLIQILVDGIRTESFYFNFKQFESNELCLFLKPLYGTWQLQDFNRCRGRCDCHEDTNKLPNTRPRKTAQQSRWTPGHSATGRTPSRAPCVQQEKTVYYTAGFCI